MDRKEILKKLEEIVKEEFDVDRFTEETDLRDDLETDSIGMLELVMDVEEEFDVNLEDVDFGDVENVGDFIDIIEKKSE